MRRYHIVLLAMALLGGFGAGNAAADEKPLWELGIGMSAFHFPDYRGSDESGIFAIPFPYVVYRGKILKADEEGVRGALLGSDRVQFNVSLGVSVPVNSDDNRARQCMPDLQPTVEFGPSLDFNIWRTGDRRLNLDLRLPVRMAVTVLLSKLQPFGYFNLQFINH